MIYDCFTFFNELDLLELRLNVLDSIVDKFVIVEATKTQNNQDKIIHLVLDEYPSNLTQWTIENLQRNKIKDGLINCKDDDIIMISDCDEIPNPKIVSAVKDVPGIKALDMRLFFYYLNYEAKEENWDHGTKILHYKDFKNILDDVANDHYHIAIDATVNQGTTASKIRLYYGEKQIHYHNAGWHFTWCGNTKRILAKAKAVCEGDINFKLVNASDMVQSGKFAEHVLEVTDIREILRSADIYLYI